MKRKGKISTEGYRADSPDRFNDFNIIPSQYIDMTDVNHDVLMIPMGGHTVGNPVLAKPGERYFFPRHNFVFEQAMPEDAMMRYQRIARYGGALKKYQGDIGGSEVPLNTTDFIYTPEEIQKYKNIYDQRIATCQKGDAACLEQANNYYNLYVAPKLSAPSTWSIAERMGITSGPNHPRFKEYGTAADSWDLAGLYKKAGAKVNLAASPKSAEELQTKLSNMSDEKLKDFWIKQNLPLGALVNFGQAGLAEHYGKGQAYNVSQGLVPSNHSARIVGYSPEGIPYIYDYGKISPITDPTFKSLPLTSITSPQEIQDYTYENLKKQSKLEGSKMNPLEIKTKGADYDPDEYEPFVESLQKNKDLYANILGVSDEEYNNYAKHAAALALTETGGGDDTSIRWKGILPIPSYITDKMGFGDTKGITQINPDVLFGKKALANKLEAVGITKNNYDPWNPDHSALATLALLKDNKAVQDKNAKTPGNKADLSEAEKTYYQWSMPGTLRKGEAKGESEKIKRYLENYAKIDAGFSSNNKYLAQNRKYGGGLSYAQAGLQAAPTYPSGKEQNTKESMPDKRRVYEQALANQIAEKELRNAKGLIDAAGLIYYPASIINAMYDATKGNYGQAALSAFPWFKMAKGTTKRGLKVAFGNTGAVSTLKDAGDVYDANPYGLVHQAYGGDPSLPALTGHYKHGGSTHHKHLPVGETNKNIKSSINQLMRRNETLFGPAGKNFYNPTPMSKYYKGGIAFPQQPTAGSTKGQQESEFYAPNWIPPGPVGFYEEGGIAYPQLPTEDVFFSAYPWMPTYAMGGLPGGANEMYMPCMECGGYMEDGGMYEKGGPYGTDVYTEKKMNPAQWEQFNVKRGYQEIPSEISKDPSVSGMRYKEYYNPAEYQKTDTGFSKVGAPAGYDYNKDTSYKPIVSYGYKEPVTNKPSVQVPQPQSTRKEIARNPDYITYQSPGATGGYTNAVTQYVDVKTGQAIPDISKAYNAQGQYSFSPSPATPAPVASQPAPSSQPATPQPAAPQPAPSTQAVASNNTPAPSASKTKGKYGLIKAQAGNAGKDLPPFKPMSQSDSLATVKFMNNPVYKQLESNYDLNLERDKGLLKKYDVLTKIHKGTGEETEVTGWEKKPDKRAAYNELLIKQQMEKGVPVTATPYFAETYNAVKNYTPIKKEMYGGYEHGGFMSPDNMLSHPVFTQGGYPMTYADGGNVLDYDQDQMVQNLGKSFMSGIQQNMQNNFLNQEMQNAAQYMMPQAHYGYNQSNTMNQQNAANMQMMQSMLNNLNAGQKDAFSNLSDVANYAALTANPYTQYKYKKLGSGTLPDTGKIAASSTPSSQSSGMARYGAAYIPAAANGRVIEGMEAPEWMSKSGNQPLFFPRQSQQAADPDAFMSPELAAKKKAFYDANTAYEQRWNQPGQGAYAPGYQSIYDMFGNQDYRVGRMSRGMKDLMPYAMFNPQNTYLQEYSAKKALFGPGARKVKMKFRTVFDPRTGQQMQVPAEDNKQTEKESAPKAQSPMSSPFGAGFPAMYGARENPAGNTFGGGCPGGNCGPAQGMRQSPLQTMGQSILNAKLPGASTIASAASLAPSYSAPPAGTTFDENNAYAPNPYAGMPGYNFAATLPGKAYGGDYKTGVPMELTEAEIGAIMAAGGQITYID